MPRAATHASAAPPDATAFLARWSSSGAAERANGPLFLSEPCDLLEDVPQPDDPDNAGVIAQRPLSASRAHDRLHASPAPTPSA